MSDEQINEVINAITGGIFGLANEPKPLTCFQALGRVLVFVAKDCGFTAEEFGQAMDALKRDFERYG